MTHRVTDDERETEPHLRNIRNDAQATCSRRRWFGEVAFAFLILVSIWSSALDMTVFQFIFRALEFILGVSLYIYDERPFWGLILIFAVFYIIYLRIQYKKWLRRDVAGRGENGEVTGTKRIDP